MSHEQQIVEGQQATQSSNSPDQAVDQHAGAGGMFSTHIIALHDGGSYTATNHICISLHGWIVYSQLLLLFTLSGLPISE